MKKIPVVDLHCDLPFYLANSYNRSPFDERLCCSFPNLKKGSVILQTMAIYTQSKAGASKFAWKQLDILASLLETQKEDISLVRNLSELAEVRKNGKVGITYSFENASGLCDDLDPIDFAAKRLQKYAELLCKPLYISLTWNEENRFGGGNLTRIGLKEDGKVLIDLMAEMNIAIDFSHTSDRLAYDIIDYVDSRGIEVPLMASHSNFRTVHKVPRNLPDDIAKEIIKRKGIIGMNLIRPFTSHDEEPRFNEHLSHALNLGAENSYCLGADFFYASDLDLQYDIPYFFEGFDNSSCYPNLFHFWKEKNKLDEDQIEKVFYQNFIRFASETLKW